MKEEIKKIKKEKEEIEKGLPSIKKVLRGTFIELYLECVRPNCKCHKGEKYRHGPYYRVSYGKGKRMHHIYVPLEMKEEVKEWTENYNKVWEGIEAISELNIKIIKEKGKKK
jgi:hypothetical protein